MQLNEFLLWLIGPGAGIASYFIIKNLNIRFTLYGLMHSWTFKRQSPKQLRRWGVVLPGMVAAAGYAVAVTFGYTAPPADVQAWGEALFQVAAAAVTAQLMHGERELV